MNACQSPHAPSFARKSTPAARTIRFQRYAKRWTIVINPCAKDVRHFLVTRGRQRDHKARVVSGLRVRTMARCQFGR